MRVKKPYTGTPAYDTLPRSSLMDRFLDSSVTLDNFEKNEFVDAGDFSGKPYEFSADAGGQSLSMLLKRSGQVTSGQASWNIALEKKVTLSLRSGLVAIDYRFINKGDSVIQTVFGSEWNINLLGGGHNESAYYRATGHTLADERLDSRGDRRCP